MNDKVKRYTVTVLGESYTIMSDQSLEHVMKSAAQVDAHMLAIVQAVQHIDHKKAAILAALQLASERLQLNELLDSMRHDQSSLIDSINREISALDSILD